MRKIFKVFKRDLKNIIKNPAAIVIVIGLSLIPSLYAWVNINACWDPYSNTGRLPVAVVNNDSGTNFNGKEINVGNEIIAELKKNKEIGWQFVGDWQGNYGLNEGKYYALIEIPQNFSSNLTTLLTKNPIKPDIIYKANEKVNAVATKITDVAEQKLTEEIKSKFIDTVNKEAFTYLNKFGGDINKEKPQILSLKDTIDSANKNLDKVQGYLNSSKDKIKDVEGYLNKVKGDLPHVTDSINSLQGMVEGNKELILNTKISIQNLGYGMKNDVMQIQAISDKYNSLLYKLNDGINITKDKENINKLIDDMNKTLEMLNKTIDDSIASLEKISSKLPLSKIQAQIDSLKKLKGIVNEDKNTLGKIKNLINSGKDENEINNALNILQSLNSDFSSKLSASTNSLYDSIIPSLNSVGDGLAQGSNTANIVLESSKSVIPQLNALASFGVASGSVASSQISQVNNKLSEFNGKLKEMQNETKGITEEKIDDAIKIMDKNPDVVASFMSSPINVKTVEVYDTSIFGVSLTPFYTVLGIWVGILLMSALLTTECEDEIDGEKLTIMEKHFGKLLLFLNIGIIQTTIVLFGDIHVLGVHPENKLLFYGMGILTCIIFTFIIFTLVSLFGNVGKAIAVVVMVFQIAGAGGIYPIQTNPKIFEVLQPLWPFTYAIDGFREAIGGPLWNDTIKDIVFLCIFGLVFLILGIIKKHIYKITMFMENKFKESGL